MKFAVYLPPQTLATSRPVTSEMFTGASYPHWSRVREALVAALPPYPTLPLRRTDLQDYARVHDSAYLAALESMAAGKTPLNPPPLSPECKGLEFCLPGYRWALGGMFEAIDQMRAGDLERAYCFSLGGHHAHAGWGHGYCLLNPLAAAACYAQEQGFARILIVDWDLHHGDGTQAIFAGDPSVYCLSIHSLADLYMARASSIRQGTTTRGLETGHGNIPVLSHSYPDSFMESMQLSGRFYRSENCLEAFRLALSDLPFRPELTLIFSGYDGHRDDCGRGIFDWTEATYAQLTRWVLEAAPGIPVLSMHGGGYRVPVNVAAALAHIEVLAGNYTLHQ